MQPTHNVHSKHMEAERVFGKNVIYLKSHGQLNNKPSESQEQRATEPQPIGRSKTLNRAVKVNSLDMLRSSKMRTFGNVPQS